MIKGLAGLVPRELLRDILHQLLTEQVALVQNEDLGLVLKPGTIGFQLALARCAGFHALIGRRQSRR